MPERSPSTTRPPTGRVGSRGGTTPRPVGRAHHAAKVATKKHCLRVDVPGLGQINLPPADELAYLGGIGLLTALEIVEWPIGVILAVGHLLASNRRNRLLRDFGAALEEA